MRSAVRLFRMPVGALQPPSVSGVEAVCLDQARLNMDEEPFEQSLLGDTVARKKNQISYSTRPRRSHHSASHNHSTRKVTVVKECKDDGIEVSCAFVYLQWDDLRAAAW